MPSLSEFAQPHPKGWEPGVEWDGTKGQITTAPLTGAPDWSDLLAVWGFSADTHEVLEPVQVRAWDTYDGRKFYFKANIQLRTKGDAIDLTALIRDARKLKRSPSTPKTTGSTLGVVLTDWQAGKGEGGGTAALAERLLDRLPLVVERAKQHEQVALLCMGDLVENCFGFYPMQLHSVDMNLRQQCEFVTEMLYEYVRAISKVRPVVVGAVPGNHGEVRVNGKAVTDFTDNMDLDVVARVQRICDENKQAFSNVTFEIATELSMVVELSGVSVGLSHGHAGRTYNPEKVRQWWANNSLSGTDIGNALLLLTAHYHHLHVDESMGKTWMQAPSPDGGSYWYTASTGKLSHPGMLLVEIGARYGDRGWGAFSVI